ncbi:hypothetical protein HPB50_025680 [Hyalomma asiaticum]|uniref:Uncharacterized protein n=1 Tax=Hyalomma asiaticum TaxID=266040 RepID=A0ACB7T4Q6_HYAAI|nr:hypothetical protein HPB50_025680 [Hyalomma asiaticum]
MRKLSKSKSGDRTTPSSIGSHDATALRLASYRAGEVSSTVPSTESPKVSPSSPEDEHGASSSEPVAASDQRVMSGLDQPSTSRGDVVKVRTLRGADPCTGVLGWRGVSGFCVFFPPSTFLSLRVCRCVPPFFPSIFIDCLMPGALAFRAVPGSREFLWAVTNSELRPRPREHAREAGAPASTTRRR